MSKALLAREANSIGCLRNSRKGPFVEIIRTEWQLKKTDLCSDHGYGPHEDKMRIVATLVPHIDLADDDEKCELVFIVVGDQSGSLSGSQIESHYEFLLLLIGVH